VDIKRKGKVEKAIEFIEEPREFRKR